MTATKNDAAATPDRELVLTRLLDAPPSLVFQAWTDPAHMSQWWGPHNYTNPVCQLDPRAGGSWRIVMRDSAGGEYPAGGIYREIVKPSRLVMTIDHSELPDEWHDRMNPARDKKAARPALTVLATVTFEDQAGKTKLTVRLRFDSNPMRDAFVKLGATQGWSQSLERLQTLLGEHPKKIITETQPFVITRVFNAPRELVWKAWTDRDRLMQWFGPKGFTLRVATLDLRPGGEFHYCMRAPGGGKDMWGKFVYREVVPPERIVLVNSFSDENGGITRHPMSPTWPLEMLTVTTFTEHAGQTTVTLQWSPLNATETERNTFEAGRSSMNQGWTGTFDQLDEYLSRNKA